MDRITLFCDILLPLPLKGCFTYRVPYEWNHLVKPGIRAVVQFGARKVLSGLIRSVHSNPPKGFHVKYILSLLDTEPVVQEGQFSFWEWMASYYMCTLGEVMNAALPPALKLSGETQIMLHPEADPDSEDLNEKEFALVQALINKKRLSFSELRGIAGMQAVLPMIQSLVERKVVMLHDHLEEPVLPSYQKYVQLTGPYTHEVQLKEVFEAAERKAPRQLEVLLRFVQLSGVFTSRKSKVAVPELLAGLKGGRSALSSLVQKGVFEEYKEETSRFAHLPSSGDMLQLSPPQQDALQQIGTAFGTHGVTLLHGVTSSGKTEIYTSLISEYLQRGLQVLYLLPEIALTTQIISRIQKRFGNRAGVYHSRFNPAERAEVWTNLLRGGVPSGGEIISYDLVLGPRSALFLPFQKLGLIIVDEEHEPGYKQIDPAPRYHARDAAIFLGSMTGAKVLLGSATPSIESYYNATSGKYGYVELSHRHGGVMLPEILIADLRTLTRQKKMKSHYSPLMLQSIGEALDKKEQVILFQNRRGFSPRLECDVCNWVPGCVHCAVSLVYHKKFNRLKCHYCGFSISPPQECPVCKSSHLNMKGFGTEKIQEELPLFFPDATIDRMDTDSTRGKHAYTSIIANFEARKTDILVGTQMVSKGLDFDNVGVVGILNADNMLSYPDFRAHERAYQLMAQVSGRAGRNQKRGKVIIQTWNPENTIIGQVKHNDYHAMFLAQMEQRREYHYPPFTRLILVKLYHSDPEKLNRAAATLCEPLRLLFPGKVLGPEYPVVPRIKNLYIKHILVKLDRGKRLPAAKAAFTKTLEEFQAEFEWKSIRVVPVVDPA